MLKGLLRAAGKARAGIAAISILQVAKAVFSAVSILALTRLMEQAWIGELDTRRVLSGLSVIAVLTVLRALSVTAAARCSGWVSLRTRLDLRQRYLDKLMELDYQVRMKHSAAEMVSQIVDGIEALDIFYAKFVPQLFAGLAIPLVLFGLLFSIYPSGALVLLAAVPVIPLFVGLIMTWASRTMGKFWNNYSDLSGAFLESLQGMTTLKLLGQNRDRLARLNSMSEEFRLSTMKLLRMQLTSATVMDVGVYLSAALGIGMGTRGFILGDISLSGALAFLLLSIEFFLPMRLLGSYFHAGTNGIAAGKKILAFFEEPVPMEGEGNILSAGVPTITFRNLTFGYDSSRPVLKDVTIKLPGPGLTAVVGPSGSGKSTLVRCLLAFHKPTGGSVSWNGEDITALSRNIIRSRAAYVGCESVIFDGTLEENLRWGCPEADRKQMVRALEYAGLSEFLVPNGALWDLRTGDQGCRLSGGQRQRLAVARVILREPDLYVFDEVAANVDADSEGLLLDTFRRLGTEKTVVMVTHRLNGLEMADRIVVLRNGSVAETGTHRELIALGGLYREMYERQQPLERIMEACGEV